MSNTQDERQNLSDHHDHEERQTLPISAAQPQGHHPRVITERTQSLYLGYVKTLRKRWAKISDEHAYRDATPTDLADLLLSLSRQIRPRTAVSYRAGLLYWMNNLEQTPDVLQARLALEVGMPKSGYKGHKPSDPSVTATRSSTRSIRPRTFSRKRFDRLIAELNHRASKTGRTTNRKGLPKPNRPAQLIVWLMAGLASGLRPAEWEHAKWIDENEGILWTKTAKRKTGQSPLPHLKDRPPQDERTRTVTIAPGDRVWVDQHMRQVKLHLQKNEPFATYYRNNRMYLQMLCKEIFPDETPFTLYMMRGQFAANRKKAVGLEKASEEMGCSAQTASSCYGNMTHAHSGAVGHTPTQDLNNESEGRQKTPSVRFSPPGSPDR